ncbi:uncharacterized protein LOC105843732 isoform X3 [Hydra vulgaris]|uniref:Uncharacterized protein LOC105843732 isoform X3 n=1 Tax=Hydra vulgaris TaxID=6087 RepID=A0ABM4BSU6_HYDVU
MSNISKRSQDTNNEAHQKDCRRKSVYTRKDSLTNQKSNRPVTAPPTNRLQTGVSKRQPCCLSEQPLKTDDKKEIVVVINNQRSTDKWKDYVKMVYKTTENTKFIVDDNITECETKKNKHKTVTCSNNRKFSVKNDLRAKNQYFENADGLEINENSLCHIDSNILDSAGSDNDLQKEGNSDPLEKSINHLNPESNKFALNNEEVPILNRDEKDCIEDNLNIYCDLVEEFKEEECSEINASVFSVRKVKKLDTSPSNKTLSDMLSDTDGSDEEVKVVTKKNFEFQEFLKPNEKKEHNAKERIYYLKDQKRNYKYTNPVIIPYEQSAKKPSNHANLDIVIDNLLSETHLVTTKETPLMKRPFSKSATNINNELDNLLNEFQT